MKIFKTRDIENGLFTVFPTVLFRRKGGLWWLFFWWGFWVYMIKWKRLRLWR